MRFFFTITLLLVAVSSSFGQGDSWISKTIVTKRVDTKISCTDKDGQPIELVLKGIVYRVVDEKAGRIKVNDGHGTDGWFDKTDALLPEDAVFFFTNEIQKNPKEPLAFNHRAVARMLTGKLDRAIEDFDEALRLGQSSFIYANRGNAWTMKKEFGKAMDDFNEAIRLEPKMFAGHMGRGLVRGSQKEFDKAIEDFSEVIRLEPKSVAAYHFRGQCWAAKKEYDKAIGDLSELLKLDPKNALVFESRGLLWRAKKKYDKAIADYDEAIRLAPKFAGAYNNLAWLLATCPDEAYRDGKRAVEMASQAVKLDSNSPAKIDTLAAAHAEAGNFEEAVRWQERALKLNNTDGYRSRLELYRKKQAFRQE